MNTLVLTVPGMSCGHCVKAIWSEVAKVPGVESVGLDLATKTVTVNADAPEPGVRAAIIEAGYEAS